MKRRVLSAFVFVVISAFCQGAYGKRPNMIPSNAQISVYENEQLKIQCFSEEAGLRFSFPNDTFMIHRSRHEIFHTGDNYTFVRNRVVIGDTGWYACAREGTEIDNDFKNLIHSSEYISWIYVYVVHPYGMVRFVDQEVNSREDVYFMNFPKTIIATAGNHIVVPCRPTSPDAINITLSQNSELMGLNEGVRYDPKIGFVIEPEIVAFDDCEAILQCHLGRWQTDTYVLRYLDTPDPVRPTMISPVGELMLQEGDELRIECHSRTKISFLFPDTTPSSSNSSQQSKHEIFKNKNGTSTFLRRKAISNDTGWYGCAGGNIGNYILYHSINYTRKEISWVYVYVNSSAPITWGSLVWSFVPTASILYAEVNAMIIPCRPTSPEKQIHVQIVSADWQVPIKFRFVQFDPKLGFVVKFENPLSTYRGKLVYKCATDGPLPYISEEYVIPPGFNDGKQMDFLIDVDYDSSVSLSAGSHETIRMAGEDLHVICGARAPDGMSFRVECRTPRTVEKQRMECNRTRTKEWSQNVYLTRKQVEIIIRNLTGSDSGTYSCGNRRLALKVFDPDTASYVKLGDPGAAKQVEVTRGVTFQLFVDLGNFSSAEIKLYNREGGLVGNLYRAKSIYYEFYTYTDSRRHFTILEITSLDVKNSGFYVLHAVVGGQTVSTINITLDVNEPLTASISGKFQPLYRPNDSLITTCHGTGKPAPNITWTFVMCPKFPSNKSSTRVHLKHAAVEKIENLTLTRSNVRWNIEMSGTLICEACTTNSCTEDKRDLYVSATYKPYFTSTNLNKSAATLSLETDRNKTFVMECFVGGWPRPDVTWFKDNMRLGQSKRVNFSYDNRELSILGVEKGDNGTYMCRAENILGKNETWIDIKLEVGEKGRENDAPDNLMRSIFITIAVLILVLIVVCCMIAHNLWLKASRKRLIEAVFRDGALKRMNPELSVVDQAELLPYNGKWEFPRELLTLGKILGSGAFGIVRKAEAQSICRGEALSTVAVKLVRANAKLSFITALSRELKILVHLGKHPNIVNLLGACTKNVSWGELFVIVEFCRFGNLHDYLRRRRDDFIDELQPESEEIDDAGPGTDGSHTNDAGHGSDEVDCDAGFTTVDPNGHATAAVGVVGGDSGGISGFRSKYQGDYAELTVESITTHDLMYWSWQVSRGMEYLEQRKVVHGDLAARNVLLADDGIVKICDFGLAKALYDEAEFRNQVDPLPVKWMAIESIKDRVFSFQSDVWTFGIVMWELFTLAETPYPGIRPENLYQKLADGHRMQRPKYASSTIYDTMLHCWEADPSKRPSFAEISHILGDLIDEGFKTHYLEISSPYAELNADFFDNVETDYLTMSLSSHDLAPDTSVQEQFELAISPTAESSNSA